ncbi:MAG: translation initiation factor [Bacteroidetes bacterium]|nr:translation initiation factor [Bacteroidota bacterium]
MSNKNKKIQGIVYSTNPDFEIKNNEIQIGNLANEKQNLIVRISTQGRAGKKATLIQRFIGSNETLEQLSKDIKKHCGTGGSVKNNEIIIQGDFCDKIVQFLNSKGFKARRG